MMTESSKIASELGPETNIPPAGEPLADAAVSPFRRELDEYLFHQGTAHRAWAYLGAHEEQGHIVFRVFADCMV